MSRDASVSVLSSSRPISAASSSTSDMFVPSPDPQQAANETLNTEIKSDLDRVFNTTDSEGSADNFDITGKKLQLYGVYESFDGVFTGCIVFLYHLQSCLAQHSVLLKLISVQDKAPFWET